MVSGTLREEPLRRFSDKPLNKNISICWSLTGLISTVVNICYQCDWIYADIHVSPVNIDGGAHIYIYIIIVYIYTYVYIHTLYTHTYQSLLHLYRFGLRDIGAHRNSLWNLGDFGLWGSNWWCSGGHWVLRKVWHWVRNASTCYYTYQEDGRFFHFHVYFFGKKRNIIPKMLLP